MNDSAVCDSGFKQNTTSRTNNKPLVTDKILNDISSIAIFNALEENIAIIDRENNCILWCSNLFASRFPNAIPGTSLVEMTQIFEGLSSSLLDVNHNAKECPKSMEKVTVCYQQTNYYSVNIIFLNNQVLVFRLRNIADVSQEMRRHLEDREKLLFTSRAISVSEMATILAHELNQPIGTIVNLLRGINLRLKRGEGGTVEVIAALESAINQSRFAAKIIARVREYTQSFQPKNEVLDISELLTTCIEMLDWEFQREGVTVTYTNPVKISLMVLGDEVMLQQVIVNLLRNSIDAMRKIIEGEKKLAVNLQLNEDQIEMNISDTGCGFTPEQEKQIFIPFVSTKPCGMGVGLNICRSFIELHQGKLWMTNNEHAGCTFHIALPVFNISNEA